MRKFCVLLLLFSVCAVSQVPRPECSEDSSPAKACPFFHSIQFSSSLQQRDSAGTLFARTSGNADGKLVPSGGYSFVSVTRPQVKQKFHWGRALLESFQLLSIEQAYVLHDDSRWVAGSNNEHGIPFHH